MIQTVPNHGTPQMLPIQLIDTRAQIRTRNGFDQQSLTELSNSIREQGVLQPLVVTPADENGRHMLVIGERRLLAASMAGLIEVPTVIRDGTPADLAAAQAVENLQREDLHVADIADGLLALKAVHGSWREVARVIGKSPAWVSKRRALTRLRPIAAGVMSEGWTSDPELLIALNNIERADPAQAGKLAAKLEQGKATREDIRKAWEAIKSAAFGTIKDAAEEDDGDQDDSEESEAEQARRRAPPLNLTIGELEWLRNAVREFAPTTTERSAVLAKLDELAGKL